jgi:hypothetical protein
MAVTAIGFRCARLQADSSEMRDDACRVAPLHYACIPSSGL